MKSILTSLIFSFIISPILAQTGKGANTVLDSSPPPMVVETSCGTCKLGLAGKTCALAIRIHGKSYFVDGADIDAFGDAHSDDGFCNAIRKAKVQGNIVNDRFKATSFVVLPVDVRSKEN